MLAFSFDAGKLETGIDHNDFYSPLFTDRIQEASIRVITGGSWDLQTLSEAIKDNRPHAFLCCLVELIPPTGNKSALFPEQTCLLSIDAKLVSDSPADKSVLFATEGSKRLYGCRPESSALRIGDQQIVNEDGVLKLVEAPPLSEQITDPYHQYRGQDIAVLELL